MVQVAGVETRATITISLSLPSRGEPTGTYSEPFCTLNTETLRGCTSHNVACSLRSFLHNKSGYADFSFAINSENNRERIVSFKFLIIIQLESRRDFSQKILN